MTNEEKFNNCDFSCHRKYCPQFKTEAMQDVCHMVSEGAVAAHMPHTVFDAVWALCENCDAFRPRPKVFKKRRS